MRNVNNSEDVLDSRDIITRIEELAANGAHCMFCADALTLVGGVLVDENKRPSCTGDWDDVNVGLPHVSDGNELDEDEREELTTLQAFASECENDVEDWTDGATFIRDSYFEDYAQEFASECYDMKCANSWPYNCIDWTQAAIELQSDYTSVDFDGVTYWIR